MGYHSLPKMKVLSEDSENDSIALMSDGTNESLTQMYDNTCSLILDAHGHIQNSLTGKVIGELTKAKKCR